MSFSYSASLGTDLDRIRCALGDVKSGAQVLENEEITAVLTQFASAPGAYWRSLAECARMILARYAHDPDRIDRSGEVEVEYRQRLRVWERIASDADARASAESRIATPETSGGPSVSGALRASDTTWIR